MSSLTLLQSHWPFYILIGPSSDALVLSQPPRLFYILLGSSSASLALFQPLWLFCVLLGPSTSSLTLLRPPRPLYIVLPPSYFFNDLHLSFFVLFHFFSCHIQPVNQLIFHQTYNKTPQEISRN